MTRFFVSVSEDKDTRLSEVAFGTWCPFSAYIASPLTPAAPRFYTKLTPPFAYLRRTRKVFTRGNAVCNIRPDISAIYPLARTHHHPAWPPKK